MATDNSGCIAERTYTLKPVCATIALTPIALPPATVGAATSQTLSASGGTAPYLFALAPGSLLPAGLALAPNGTLSGSPTAAGSFSFTVISTDANGCTGQRTYPFTATCPVVQLAAIATTTTAGTSVNLPLSASGGTAPYTFALKTGSTLPLGLSLETGRLSGILLATGSFGFTLVATDANGCVAEQAYTLAVTCPAISVSPASLPPATVGAVLNQPLTGSGGTAPYRFTLAAGSTLPTGLTLANGALSGVPAVGGNFTLVVTDTLGCAGQQAYVFTATCPAVSLAPATFTGTVGTPLSVTLTASGGTAPYAYTLATNNALPSGLTLVNGVIAGTPTAGGTFVFRITATDVNGCAGTREYTFVPTSAPLACTATGTIRRDVWNNLPGRGLPFALPTVAPNATSFRTSLSGTSEAGARNYFALFRGTICAPTTGTYQFALASNANSALYLNPTGDAAFASLPDPVANINGFTFPDFFNFLIVDNGGSRQISAPVSLTAGQRYYVEVWHKFGTPAFFGIFNQNLSVGWRTPGSSTFTTVPGSVLSPFVPEACPAFRFSTPVLASAAVGVAYTQAITGAPADYAYVAMGLPSGLAISASGVITGTPTQAFSGNVTITARQGNCARAQVYPLVVRATPSPCLTTGSLRRDVWVDMPGLTLPPTLPTTAPTATTYTVNFAGPTDTGVENYLAAYRGYLCAPVTGAYRFFLASDEASVLYLNEQGESPTTNEIARIDFATLPTDWQNLLQSRRNPRQGSFVINLVAGRRYYVEARHKQGTGSDNFSVGWLTPGSTFVSIVPSSVLSPLLPPSGARAAVAQLSEADQPSTTLEAFPNPFSTTTTLRFATDKDGPARLDLYDGQGRLLRPLFAGTARADATQTVELTENGLANGLYVVQLRTGQQTHYLKVMVAR